MLIKPPLSDRTMDFVEVGVNASNYWGQWYRYHWHMLVLCGTVVQVQCPCVAWLSV